ncbi:hypothetical protein [Lysobacter gummosus]|uniref:hypothetical protein n=1 Tax=Lysobacter gummosus TaxID=262324 RepID=UPI00363491DF
MRYRFHGRWADRRWENRRAPRSWRRGRCFDLPTTSFRLDGQGLRLAGKRLSIPRRCRAAQAIVWFWMDLSGGQPQETGVQAGAGQG